jgi:hypothetical protein
MNLSQLRPCDHCKKPLNGVTFHTVHSEHHVIDQSALRQRLGMETFFGGAAALAETFDAYGDAATKSLSDFDLILCETCFCADEVLARGFSKDEEKEP